LAAPVGPRDDPATNVSAAVVGDDDREVHPAALPVGPVDLPGHRKVVGSTVTGLCVRSGTGLWVRSGTGLWVRSGTGLCVRSARQRDASEPRRHQGHRRDCTPSRT
jgi:hypothetical protein